MDIPSMQNSLRDLYNFFGEYISDREVDLCLFTIGQTTLYTRTSYVYGIGRNVVMTVKLYSKLKCVRFESIIRYFFFQVRMLELEV